MNNFFQYQLLLYITPFRKSNEHWIFCSQSINGQQVVRLNQVLRRESNLSKSFLFRYFQRFSSVFLPYKARTIRFALQHSFKNESRGERLRNEPWLEFYCKTTSFSNTFTTQDLHKDFRSTFTI